MENIRQQAEIRVDRKIKFYKQLYVYICVNVVLFIINYLFSPNFWWFLFPAFLWGIGVLFEFIKIFVLSNSFDKGYREKMIQKELDNLKE